jgi:hypothetical protein
MLSEASAAVTAGGAGAGVFRRADVLFVTRDQKQDWWRIENRQAKGPRWELVAELESHAGTRLYTLRPASLGEHASEPLPEESVEDARRVSNKAYIGWQAQPGWGSVRNYVEIPTEDGQLSIAFKFVFDDGSGSQPAVMSDPSRIPELAEYARGIFADDHITIKVGAEAVARAERMFNEINLMEPAKRALLFMDSTDLHEQAGYAWTPDYKLEKAAPGLMD